jgi:hypothetical protein
MHAWGAYVLLLVVLLYFSICMHIEKCTVLASLCTCADSVHACVVFQCLLYVAISRHMSLSCNRSLAAGLTTISTAEGICIEINHIKNNIFRSFMHTPYIHMYFIIVPNINFWHVVSSKREKK